MPDTTSVSFEAIAEASRGKGIGTRFYGTVERLAIGSTSAASTTVWTCTEVLLHASVKCYVVRAPASPGPTASATTGIPLEAGEKFHMRIAPGDKIAVIRDTEDGYLHIAPAV